MEYWTTEATQEGLEYFVLLGYIVAMIAAVQTINYIRAVRSARRDRNNHKRFK